MKLNFWPFSVIDGQRVKIDRMMVDLHEQDLKLRTAVALSTQYRKDNADLFTQPTSLRDHFTTGRDAPAGSWMIGGYSPAKSGDKLALAVGRETLASGQVVVFAVPENEQTKVDQQYMFRLNVLRNTRL